MHDICKDAQFVLQPCDLKVRFLVGVFEKRDRRQLRDARGLRDWFCSNRALSVEEFTDITGNLSDQELQGIDQRKFEQWRALLRSALKTDPKNWGRLNRSFPTSMTKLLFNPFTAEIDVRSKGPALQFFGDELLEAMIATIQLDKLAGWKHRFCLRHDCGKPYAVDSARPKKYCSSHCARLVSVRNFRRRNKQRASLRIEA